MKNKFSDNFLAFRFPTLHLGPPNANTLKSYQKHLLRQLEVCDVNHIFELMVRALEENPNINSLTIPSELSDSVITELEQRGFVVKKITPNPTSIFTDVCWGEQYYDVPIQ